MAYGDLIHFSAEGKAAPQRWSKLEFGSTAGRDEAWLRDALHGNGDTLPVRAIPCVWPSDCCMHRITDGRRPY